MKPNLGRFADPPEWKEIFNYFKGSELQKFFMSMIQDEMRALIKIQYVDSVAKSKAATAKVGAKLKAADKKGIMDDAIEALDLENVLERQIGQLSGGELQRFVIAMTCLQKADIYMFDEPSSYLDVKQRLNAARMIRSQLAP